MNNDKFINTLLKFIPELAEYSDQIYGNDSVVNICMQHTQCERKTDIFEAIAANTDGCVEKIKNDIRNLFIKEGYITVRRNDARVFKRMMRDFVSRNCRMNIMIIGAVVGLLFCVSMLSFCKGLSGEVVGIISTVSGIFGSCLKDAYSFEFGSSRGSREKDLLYIS